MQRGADKSRANENEPDEEVLSSGVSGDMWVKPRHTPPSPGSSVRKISILVLSSSDGATAGGSGGWKGGGSEGGGGGGPLEDGGGGPGEVCWCTGGRLEEDGSRPNRAEEMGKMDMGKRWWWRNGKAGDYVPPLCRCGPVASGRPLIYRSTNEWSSEFMAKLNNARVGHTSMCWRKGRLSTRLCPNNAGTNLVGGGVAIRK